jgi:hypothetical protein
MIVGCDDARATGIDAGKAVEYMLKGMSESILLNSTKHSPSKG